jgi:hypothetical protein
MELLDLGVEIGKDWYNVGNTGVTSIITNTIYRYSKPYFTQKGG